MATIFQQTTRAKIVLTTYVVLVWFLLVLGGSLLGTFAKSPLVFYLTIGGPVILGVSGYLLITRITSPATAPRDLRQTCLRPARETGEGEHEHQHTLRRR